VICVARHQVDDGIIGDREDSRDDEVRVLDVLMLPLLGGHIAHGDEIERLGLRELGHTYRQAQQLSAARRPSASDTAVR
jgi:hypothetical protein